MRPRWKYSAVALLLSIAACNNGDQFRDAELTNAQDAGDKARHSLFEAFAAAGEKAVTDGLVEGFQFALVENGEIVGTAGFGLADRETRRAMTADTPLNVGSISKSLTAWGILAFAATNGVSLDTPINDFFSGYQFKSDNFNVDEVTIGRLLNHTSGISTPSVPVTPAALPLPNLISVLEGEDTVPKAEIGTTPGERYAYSGAGYLLLQKLLEDQTGEKFADFMSAALLSPAGMEHSTFLLNDDFRSRTAIYYRGDGRRREPYHLVGAAGGLYSTATHVARFVLLYTANGKSVRNAILSDEAFDDLLAPQAAVRLDGVDTTDVEYALGHYVYKTPEGATLVFHGGGNPGLRAYYVIALETGDGFFAVANNDRGTGLLAALLTIWGDHQGLTPHQYF